MNKRRILLLTNRVPYPLNDGGSLAMHAMIMGYKEAGWDVAVLSMNTSRHPVKKDLVERVYPGIGFMLFDINTDLRFFPLLRNFLFSSLPDHAERFYSRGYEAVLLNMIDKFRPDMVQLESIYMAGFIPAIKKRTNVPVLIRLHNIEYQIWERLAAATANPFKRYYLTDLAKRIRTFELKAWKDADALLPITEVDAAIVRNAGMVTPVFTASLGIALTEAPAPQELSEWVGYHIGAMDWLPNAEAISWFLQKVWPLVHQKLPDFRFFFAGRNMPDQFKALSIDGVVCAGEVRDAALFIADKKILIVPLRSGGGVRVKVLEAMAAGKLVISTAVGMQGIEYIKPGEHYLEANTPAEFLARFQFVFTEREAAVRIAAAGKETVRSRYDRTILSFSLISRLESFLVDFPR